MAIKYRPEIDGLRAVAVVPIVLFHAGISQISGGFVGVDIFFVISGFLITSIILREIDEDRFTISGFYRRRAVRILPALLAMLTFALLAGAFILLPFEIEQLGSSAIASALFASNLWFWRNTDYFAGAAEQEILLHTWSLGVEEQFYIFYPLVLILVMRFVPGRLRSALAVLALASIMLGLAIAFLPQPPALSFISAQRWETLNFYMLPMRGWELLLGALCAVGVVPAIRSVGLRSALSGVGMALIVAGYFVVEPGKWFPIPSALLPCLGTALIIAYSQETAIGRVLSHRVLTWIGAISYSLYLWHWPIIAFYRIETGLSLDAIEIVGLSLASIAAAAMSYYLFEQPFLRRFRSASSRRVLPVAAGALVALCLGCFVMVRNADQVSPLPPDVARIASFANYTEMPDHTVQFDRLCFSREGGTIQNNRFDFETCLAPLAEPESYLLLGDSHMGQFRRVLDEAMPGSPVAEVTAIGCRPLIKGEGAPRCRAIYDRFFGSEIGRRTLDTIVLGARWREDELPELAETIRYLKRYARRVVVIGPITEYEGTTPALIARARLRGEESIKEYFSHERVKLNEKVRRLAREAGARFVDLQALECPEGECILFTPDGNPMKFDYGHVTLEGSRLLASRFDLQEPTKAAE